MPFGPEVDNAEVQVLRNASVVYSGSKNIVNVNACKVLDSFLQQLDDVGRRAHPLKCSASLCLRIFKIFPVKFGGAFSMENTSAFFLNSAARYAEVSGSKPVSFRNCSKPAESSMVLVMTFCLQSTGP